MAETKRSKSKQQYVNERMSKRLCLVASCNRSCDEKSGGLGRCAKCYAALKRELMNRSFKEQIAIRTKYEKAGTLLRNQEIREYEKLPAEAG